MKLLTKFSVLLLLMLLVMTPSFAQDKNINDLGNKVFSIIKSDNPDSLVALFSSLATEEQKADIMKSFLELKSKLQENSNFKNFKLINSLELPNQEMAMVLSDKKKFIVIKVKTINNHLINDKFVLVSNQINKDLAAGQKIFKIKCYSCHGRYGQGGLGPSLIDKYWKYASKDEDILKLIAEGKKGTMMISYKNYLTPKEMDDVTLYLKTMNGRKVKNSKKPEGNKQNFKLNLDF